MKVTFDVPEMDICTKELYTALQTAVDKVREEYMESQKWPKKGDIFYFVNITGKINHYIFCSDPIDYTMMAFGNFFKTREEAEFHAKRLKVMAELFKLTDDDKEWDDNNYHWILQYVPDDNNVYPCGVRTATYGQYHFASRESAKAAIEKIGKDRLIKYYFGIVEDEEC